MGRKEFRTKAGAERELRRQCKICSGKMRESGKVSVKNPRTMRNRMHTVFRCGACGHRTIG